MDFADIILDRLRELDLNVNQAEARAGFEQGYIRGVIRNDAKRATPGVDKAEKIARALDLEFYIGPRRPRDHGFHEPGGNGAPTILAPPTGYATFVWEGSDLRGIPPLAFSQAWINRHGLDYDRHLCTYVGEAPRDSAEPDSLAIIDRHARHEGGPALWALRHSGGRVELAHLQFDGSLALIAADTPGDPIRVIRASAATPHILGRVLWHGSVK
jgi:hypothetical protein